jgi:tRNA-Thr(GGU) m(6)t(6)A37 methyltransferase TsaA
MADNSYTIPPFSIQPIGIISTPYTEKYHAPRQPGVANEPAVGIISLFPHCNYEQALADLEGFERIWIISWFHKNSDWRPKVLPPRSGRERKGVFSTRSPHRPNPIGLSLCKLIEISGRTVRVEHPDLLDGTPILDLKPYLPYAEAFPGSKTGWLEAIQENDSGPYIIEVSELAARQAEWLKLKFDIHLIDRTSETLSQDPFPHSSRRITPHPEGGFVMAAKSWRIRYDVHEHLVLINSISSGYPQEAIDRIGANTEPLHDQEAHVQFYKKWNA